ncbi:bifunctional isocitrate dehydrogenase kinase/phosphatase [Cocleimonas flava]|uniref:Isocitrate dehydrogenase kinase/phosphatase n=1 Tax=Cocleimonas flava TaxID=634765 RepID=A0A4R1EYF7_9GAMM|nr:bifunctional isocitrate dehydrogenase kinase/phosphatase [Cocleimonas flava]TCJ86867.1 isocitrate dehydrogenase kinase/phosphatase [Cocleimonas flava]
MNLSRTIAKKILKGFNKHFRIFTEITSGAQARFESADWKADRLASRHRIEFYDSRVKETVNYLKENYDTRPETFDQDCWKKVKGHFILLLQNHQQPELAETFFNSVFCRIFPIEFYTNLNIFLRSSVATEYIDSEVPTYEAYYPANTSFFRAIKLILNHSPLSIPFENCHRDCRHMAKSICKYMKNDNRNADLNFQFQVINALFYRNKAAYIVGKAINGHNEYPFAIPLLNNEKGGIYTDALLIGEDSVSRLFSFSYAYFMVEHPVPSAIVSFLQRLMPQRKKEALYSSIGLHKQGKTDFYRGFLHHLDYSDDDLILAPGIPGMVMSVFTLASYPYVFKLIRDYFAPPKEISRQQVEEKYQLVKRHDRVGRMADTLEFSEVLLPLNRFTEDLLKDLESTCKSSIQVVENHKGVKQLKIKHMYIERRMQPLNMALEEAERKGQFDEIERLILSFGDAIKELCAANIFPGDLLYKNFGVTRLRRVVFYDYDEIVYLTDCNFRKIPAPRNSQELMAAEPWYSVGPNDVFPEEFARFLLGNDYIKAAFMKYHADLLDANFWIQKQENIKNGIFEDVFPYPQKYRLQREVSDQ